MSDGTFDALFDAALTRLTGWRRRKVAAINRLRAGAIADRRRARRTVAA